MIDRWRLYGFRSWGLQRLWCHRRCTHEVIAREGLFRQDLRPTVALDRSKPEMVLRKLFNAEKSPTRLPRYYRRDRQARSRAGLSTVETRRVPACRVAPEGNCRPA